MPYHSDRLRWPADTARLSFRPMTLDDLDFIHSMLSDEETMRYYPNTYDRDGAQKWVERTLQRYAENGVSFWIVSDRKSGTPLGQVGLIQQTVEGKSFLEVGYMIYREHWRKGIATEGALACRDFAFEEFDIDALHALVRPINVPSQGVARKLGMTPLPDRVTFCDLEHFLFKTSRDKWNAAKSSE